MDVFLLSAARTPIGKFLGELADVPAPKLGAAALAEALKRANVSPAQVDEVIFGNVVQAGVGQNPARQAALFAGLHFGVWLAGSFTVDPGVYEALHMKPPNPLPSYTVSANVVLPGLANTAALLLAVSGYTMWLSAAGRSRTKVLGLAILATLVQFLVNVIGQLWDGMAFLRPFTVFYYYQPQAINLKGAWTVDPGPAWTGRPLVGLHVVLVLGLVGAVGYAMALRTFVRRDVPAPL
jgi:ABC-2 type transport system permease protein